MIQRIQTIWLLFATACAFISLRTSFYISTVPPVHFTGTTDMLILILSVIIGTIALVDIFLFKNRSLQLKITIADLALSILVIALYFMDLKKYSGGGFALTAAIVFLIPVLLFLACRGIYRDQKLVKSADRLR
jgi:hypothetical protein